MGRVKNAPKRKRESEGNPPAPPLETKQKRRGKRQRAVAAQLRNLYVFGDVRMDSADAVLEISLQLNDAAWKNEEVDLSDVSDGKEDGGRVLLISRSGGESYDVLQVKCDEEMYSMEESDKVLHAMAFLNEKQCLSMFPRGDTLIVRVDCEKYANLSRNASQPDLKSPISKSMAVFMRWLIQKSLHEWNYPYPSELTTEAHDAEGQFQCTKLYSYVPARPTTREGDAYQPSSDLLPTLRRYQKAAVAWMLGRENLTQVGLLSMQEVESIWQELNGDTAKMTQVHATHRTGIIYNPFNASFNSLGDVTRSDIARLRGGILADEMGLGKTVQVISCLLSNPRPPQTIPAYNVPRHHHEELDDGPKSCVCGCEDDIEGGWIKCTKCGDCQHRLCSGYTDESSCFLCEKCLRYQFHEYVVKCTLIISPASIHKQWEREILRHTKPNSLTIYTYEGIKVMRQRCKNRPSSEWKYCRADKLAQFDVILTTYETLKNDLFHAIPSYYNSGRRQHKRYRVVASPLTHMAWWRVCMDEAQMVENTDAMASQMALELNSTLRWCVSGTPFTSSLWDVFGAIAFLGVQPFQEKGWWRSVIQRHASDSNRLGEMIQMLMWRNRKVDVVDQINLPPQLTQTSWLELSSIESHFYNQQLSECTRERHERDVTPGMLHSLLRLRQACCNPQVGSNGIKALDDTRPMNMDEILDEMLQNAQRECEEAQRVLVASLNGLAAVAMLMEQKSTAIERYFEALSLIRHNWQDFRADLLPRLHILYNFGKLLASVVGNDDEQFENAVGDEDAKSKHCLPSLSSIKQLVGAEISTFVTEDALPLVKAALGEMTQSAQVIERFYLKQVTLLHDVAYNKYLSAFKSNQEEHFGQSKDAKAALNKLHATWMSLLSRVAHEDHFVDRVRAKLMSRSDTGMAFASKIRSMVSLKAVVMQEIDKMMSMRWEIHKRLLHLSEKEPTMADIDQSGNCAFCREDRKGEKCQHCVFKPDMDKLRAWLGISNDEDKNADQHAFNLCALIQDFFHELDRETSASSVHDKMAAIFAALRKEQQLAAKLWKAQHARLGGLDELEMAKTTIQLRHKDEKIRESEKQYKLLLEEIPVKQADLEEERKDASNVMKTKLSQLRYLSHLHRIRHQKYGNEQECAVCHEMMDHRIAVWPCAHMLCLVCTESMIQRARPSIRCPTCRQTTLPNKVVFVREDAQEPRLDPSGYGTKVDAIVARIKTLGDAKTLVFSQWPDMIKIVVDALKNDGVQCFQVQNKKSFDKTLQLFKQHQGGCVLALQFKHGANGLNIVEARHVVLIEPLLNAGVEAQAINRVHRLGQDAATVVHRFIVSNTIEEGILVVQEKKQSQNAVVKKHEKEDITWNEWNMLLQLDRVDVYDAFWSEEIAWSGRRMTRMQAKETFERATSFELLQEGQRLVDATKITVCGVNLPIPVAKKLIHDCDDTGTAHSDLLDMLRHRLEVHSRLAS